MEDGNGEEFSLTVLHLVSVVELDLFLLSVWFPHESYPAPSQVLEIGYYEKSFKKGDTLAWPMRPQFSVIINTFRCNNARNR